ncbi:alpha/beta hydrolase [Corynebacterium sp. 320]|nr:alpha/beta hydrolase [Corynebacterium sp. 320]KAB1550512.1 alpha/beta hydrolase [Corynebacterium sp. 319]KAB1554760.1 alpha/beta hydrolase [Corynebacterium sp. 321]KAB3526413.1 alpha/beta hydrolase [Corynebacterium sp. 250]KAB3539731.1 alpha/beta hydrolase [Corynebacterium sp. 366]
MVLIVVSRIMETLGRKCFREGSGALTLSKLTVGKWRIAYDLFSDAGLHPQHSHSLDRPRVVQLHGLTSSMQRDQVLGLNFLSSLGEFEGLRFDAPGHGQTRLVNGAEAVEDDFVWGALAETLHGVLGQVWPECIDKNAGSFAPLVGIGQSMGCATLLTAQVRYPGLFDKLILGIPPTIWSTRSERAHGYELSAAYVEEHGLEAYSEYTRQETLPPAVRPDRPHTAPDVLESMLPIVYRGAARANLPPQEDIAGIECPVLILGWVGDAGHPVESAETLAEVLPHAQMHIARTPEDVDAWPQLMRDFIR